MADYRPLVIVAGIIRQLSDTDTLIVEALKVDGASVTSTLIGQWSTAYGWGDHAGLYDAAGAAAALTHDGFADFVANEHIDWTNTTRSISTTGGARIDGGIAVGGAVASNAAIWTSKEFVGNSGSWYGQNIGAYSNPTEISTGTIVGCQVTARSSSGNTYRFAGYFYGGIFNVFHQGTGTMDDAYGGYFFVSNSSTGIITTACAVRVGAAVNASGTITTNVGMYLEEQTTGVTDWQVYSVNGNWRIGNDNSRLVFGTGNDASIYYDGTNLVVNPKVVGAGILDILGTLQTDGYNAADGTAGATADVAVDQPGGAGTRTLHFKSGLYTGYTDS